jgi:hypothetical protein
VTKKKAAKRKPYEGAGRQPLVARGVEPPTLYARVHPHNLDALDALVAQHGLETRAEGVRALLEALDVPAVRKAIDTWMGPRQRAST